MKTKAKSLMSREFLLAATTVAVLLLKALFNLTLNEKATQGIVLSVVAYIVGQDALSAEPVAA
jgi:DMSO reductase anchor subunit